MAEASTRGSAPRRGAKSQAAFRTIGEVAAELDLPQHVLRFWETRFPQIKPLKRGGGRRYYRPEDMIVLRCIRRLLHDDGYTIKGAQRLLRDGGAKSSEDCAEVPRDVASGAGGLDDRRRAELRDVLADLQELRDLMRGGDR